MIRPFVEEPTYHKSERIKSDGGWRDPMLFANIDIHWDERATISVKVCEPENPELPKNKRFELLAKKANRIAEMIANAPAMVNRLHELESTVHGGTLTDGPSPQRRKDE